MGELAALLVQWIVTTTALFTLVLLDERRLARRAPDRHARCWPPATRGAAVLFWGVLALPIHFWRTRRGLLGVALGVAWAMAITLLTVGVSLALDAIAPETH